MGKTKTKEKTDATARKAQAQGEETAAESKWKHPNKARCPRCAGTMVKSRGTRNDGMTKRWECQHPICRHRWETQGTPL